MSKIYVIGIGFRPLNEDASRALRNSDYILSNDRLLEIFQGYDDFEHVQQKIKIIKNANATIDFIKENQAEHGISILAAGDPMFYGIGRVVVESFGKAGVEVYPDLSSVQVAFARIKETANDALLVSFHGGPDPEKRRKLEYEIAELPALLDKHKKIAALTDRENNPSVIAKILVQSSGLRPSLPSSLKMFVCEKLGYPDEKITEGAPDKISKMSFEHPNVVIIIKLDKD